MNARSTTNNINIVFIQTDHRCVDSISRMHTFAHKELFTSMEHNMCAAK